MDYEQVHYGIAYEAVEKFVFENPDFVEKALDKIFLEFISEASKTTPYSNYRLQLEKTVAARICALSSLGCNDKCKNKIIDFVTQKLVNKKCAVMGIIYVIDSPYAKITKQDFELLFDYARDSGDFNKDLFKCLYNWKKEDVVVLVKEYVAKTKMQQKYQNIKKMEEKENQENCQKQQEECPIY